MSPILETSRFALPAGEPGVADDAPSQALARFFVDRQARQSTEQHLRVHDDLFVVGDVGGGTNQMLEVAPLHPPAPSRTRFQIAQRSRGPTTPAKGVAC